MDWNIMKATSSSSSWDLTELDQEAFTPDKETIDHHGSSRKGEFSVDLKLGHQVGNSSNELPVVLVSKSWKDVNGGNNVVSKVASSSSSPSPSGSSKRARAINNGSHTVVVSCLVDGCNSDLSNCRDYHRRHKVCELHSKTPMVTIGGHKQRFCQQCSRFHCLEEFDEGKRSCRKRLDGHNRRRRKPQPEAFVRSASFLCNYQGTQLLPFSSSQSHVYPLAWNAETRRHHNQLAVHHNLVDHKQDLFLGSASTSNYKQEGNVKQLAFLQAHNSTTIPPPSPSSSPPVSVSLRTRLHNHDHDHDHDQDSHCALSLLSSSPRSSTRTSGSVLSPMVHHRLHDRNLESVDPVLVPTSGSHHCPPPMYNTNEAPHPPFPFHWE